MSRWLALFALLTATVVTATPPPPTITMSFEWRSPETLVVHVDSQDVHEDATLIVAAGERVFTEQPFAIRKGRVEAFVTVPVANDVEDVNVRVMTPSGTALLSDRLHIARDGSGGTRLMSREEVEAMYAAQREEERQRAVRTRYRKD
ncbi:MAG TPA: hypothetical protein VFN10_08145 [Thermoanaerobaculia bacterium]|nr:hypothetical protein [Thermoanaerobaculia bacterium]